ncbi:TPA: hypothetical protein EYO57_00195 [Candidatus Poribacteria bacterium]|nr:hypothetical protein [Candidatus Poribacteria bacterium]
MRQLSLYESFRRCSKYPCVIAEIIHSYLPTTEVLFLEQRLRFLLESKNLISDRSCLERKHSFSDIDTIVQELYNIIPDQLGRYQVALLRDPSGPSVSFKQLSVCYDDGEVHQLSHYQTPLKIHNVELDYEPDFAKLVLMLEKELNEINKEMIGHTNSLFPGGTSFALLRTMRHDNKVVFYPTPTVRTIHLLL